MVRINLTPDFMPFGEGLPMRRFNFPSGVEPHIKLTRPEETLYGIEEMKFLLTCRFANNDDVMTLFLANDALRRMGAKHIEVFISFLPFARQDRVMVEGEPFSLKMYATMINNCNFNKVYLYDVHSDVSTALIDNSVNFDNSSFVRAVTTGLINYVIVTPDAGAYKKIYKVVGKLTNKPVKILTASKERSLGTGEITAITLPEFDYDSVVDYIIVDDICDGGATFLPLAEMIKRRSAGAFVHLAVTHGIFSKGAAPGSPLYSAFNTMHTTNSIRNKTEGVIVYSITNLHRTWPISI